MARSDLLISLVKAGSSGDQALFRKTVEALIAEERGKRHDVLADRLAEQLARNGTPFRDQRTSTLSNGTTGDLCIELLPKRTLDELILTDTVKAVCMEFIEEHNRSDLLRSYNLQPRHRVLLTGPPGNGKTTLANALANALAVPLIVVRYEGLIASYLGETAARLRRLFDYVRTRSCVLFFDEFETLGKERGDIHETGEIKRVVSSLLLQIDDLPQHVVVVTATNHPELLDRAVWRRFQIKLELARPTRNDVERYFNAAATRLSFPLGVNSRVLAEKLAGASYSELEDFLADVARRYVLSLPTADTKGIVQQRLKEWNHRFVPPDQG
jgi:SpoVK/Ycf46/Vps4 family AAA+-type ATPase